MPDTIDTLRLEVTELDRVELWRATQLERAGYMRGDADRLAIRHDIDLHNAVALIKRGCDSATATDILL